MDDIVLIAETMAYLLEDLYDWKGTVESKGLNVNLVKTKIVVSNIGHVTVRPSNKKDPCGMCGRRTMVDAVLCKSCEDKGYDE